MRRVKGNQIVVTFHGRAGEKVTAQACRTDVKQSRGWRKRWCSFEVRNTKKAARRAAVKKLLKKITARRAH